MNDTIGSLMHCIRFWLLNENKVQAELKPFADKFDEMKERIAQLEDDIVELEAALAAMESNNE